MSLIGHSKILLQPSPTLTSLPPINGPLPPFPIVDDPDLQMEADIIDDEGPQNDDMGDVTSEFKMEED